MFTGLQCNVGVHAACKKIEVNSLNPACMNYY